MDKMYIENEYIENKNLVHHIVKKYKGLEEYDDLCSVGTIGLLNAIKTFDAKKKIKKSTYYCVCIRNEISEYFRTYKNKQLETVSLSTEIVGDITLKDVLKDDINIEIQTLSKVNLRKVLDSLTEREKRIIEDRIAGKTQVEIAAELSITKQRVFAILQKIKVKMKNLFLEEIENK